MLANGSHPCHYCMVNERTAPVNCLLDGRSSTPNEDWDPIHMARDYPKYCLSTKRSSYHGRSKRASRMPEVASTRLKLSMINDLHPRERHASQKVVNTAKPLSHEINFIGMNYHTYPTLPQLKSARKNKRRKKKPSQVMILQCMFYNSFRIPQLKKTKLILLRTATTHSGLSEILYPGAREKNPTTKTCRRPPFRKSLDCRLV